MAGPKRSYGRSLEDSDSTSSSYGSGSSSLASKKSKRQTSLATFEKWQRNFDANSYVAPV